ncbi:REST corepressor 3-like [Tropilaelaps mercedesae]|uniref:REST corepressor 3-like n=1 Tax=Tropilaelaps mercedesae TaxID=418985 RepID=A0A1V9X5T0_9ACAR|nr:REST corepressor 3-like [Tropilaelaps mercedesae]
MSRPNRRAKQEGDVKTDGLRIGPEFQADIPILVSASEVSELHRADLLYQPDDSDGDYKNEDKKFLGNPYVRWTTDEKANFKRCFSRHKKKFHRYKDLLPNKTIVQLLDYYYSTKIRELPEPPLSRDPDYNPGKGSPRKNGRNLKRPVITGSGRILFSRRVDQPHSGDRLRFTLGEIDQVIENDETSKQLDELQKTASRLGEELVQNKVESKDHKQVEMYRRLCNSSWPCSKNVVGTPWTDSELILAVHSIRVYGKDFKAVARLIGNKTEAQVRLFFANYRERYNLELMVRQFEEDRRNGLISRGSFALLPTQPPDTLSPTGSPVKKLIRSPLKKPSILSRRKV